MVKALFAVAREVQPSIIFIGELTSVFCFCASSSMVKNYAKKKKIVNYVANLNDFYRSFVFHFSYIQ